MLTGNTRLTFQFFYCHRNFLINWFQFMEAKLRSTWQGIREIKKIKERFVGMILCISLDTSRKQLIHSNKENMRILRKDYLQSCRQGIGKSKGVVLVTTLIPKEGRGGSVYQGAVVSRPFYRSCDPQMRDTISQLRTYKEGHLSIGQIQLITR